MALTDEPEGTGGPEGTGAPTSGGTRPGARVAQGRRAPAPFELDTSRSIGYRIARAVFVSATGLWFRPVVRGRDRVPRTGAAILAPVHRSFADFGFTGFLTRRKLFFMVKDELWERPSLGRLIVALGGFPVHRESADREALRRAQDVLERGELLVLFPEGARNTGPEVGVLHEGAAFLAARTGAPIVPVGIGGSDVSMPKGRLLPRPLRIHVVVGEPVAAPRAHASGRVPRNALRDTTEELRAQIQSVYDQARAGFEAG